MESEHNTLASASCLGRQPNSEPAPSASRDNNTITGSKKDKCESLIMEGFETIIHNYLTKIRKKKKKKTTQTLPLKFTFKQKKKGEKSSLLTIPFF